MRFFYITVLRALAAILITNAHYTGVYPSDLIANGGLLGDVIFFAVSGFCLCNIKMSFIKWYGKRILRIYPAVWIITLIYMLLGFYTVTSQNNLVWWYVYPTYYHFVASIIILYIPLYFVGKYNIRERYLVPIVIVLWLVIYMFLYDKTTYHIDTVREPMIRFLFFISMMIGVHFRRNYDKYNKQLGIWVYAVTFIMLILYFGSKLIFTKFTQYASYQILNQFVLLILLYFIFLSFSGLNKKMELWNGKVKSVVKYIANITLEIYMVQYVIIPTVNKIGIFPLNWILITLSILVSASVLHFAVKFINEKWLNKLWK